MTAVSMAEWSKAPDSRTPGDPSGWLQVEPQKTLEMDTPYGKHGDKGKQKLFTFISLDIRVIRKASSKGKFKQN
jgi:hypothetical protein